MRAYVRMVAEGFKFVISFRIVVNAEDGSSNFLYNNIGYHPCYYMVSLP
jgi:hypothetical protein